MVELKVVQRGRKAGLSPHQVAFHAKHASLGCPTFVFLQYFPPGAQRAGESELRLYAGSQVIELAAKGLDVLPCFSWPYRGMHWEQLHQRLLDEP